MQNVQTEALGSVMCLILFKDRRKVVEVGGERRKDDVIAALRGTDFEEAAESARIEVYNTRFDTFVDSAEDHVFYDGDKIKLMTEEVKSPMLPSTPEEIGDSGACGEGLSQASLQAAGSSKAAPAFLASEYQLPAVPFDIKVDIDNARFGELPKRTKSRIVAWVTTDLRTRGPYPDKLYEVAARALIYAYPVLRDTIGTGFDSWKLQFQYKMGNIRKDMGDVPAVQAARKKFGSKRTSAEGSSQTQKQRRLISDDVDTESAESVDGHICFMQAQLKKRTPDMKKISDSMRKTRPARRKWMDAAGPTTAAVLEKYPALALPEMLHEEFRHIANVDLDSMLLEFINTHGEKCLHLCQKIRSAQEHIKKLQSELEALEGDEKKYRFAVGVVELLPRLVKERPYFLEGPDAYPSLILRGQKPEAATAISAAFEDYKVDAVDVTGALVHLVEIYWVFNIKYSKRNQNFFALLEHFFKLKSSKKMTPSVLQAIASLERAPEV